jgi:hypothetical protein
MKSVSSRKEKDENMPSMCKPSEGRKVKSVFEHLPHQTNQGQVGHFDTRIPDMTCHNSEMSNSFQIRRTKSIGVGHPGHYFQKALNSFTQKTRSQSLPSCIESKKLSCVLNDDNKEVMHSKQPDESKNVDVITFKVNNTVSNETWFRTWPERGIDKLSSSHNNISCTVECAEFNKEGSCFGSEDERSGKDNPYFRDNTPTSVSDSVCKSVSSTNQSCYSFSRDKTIKPDICASKTNPIQSSSQCKSDFLSDYDIEDYGLSIQHISSTKPIYTFESSGISPGKAPIPLRELLQNFPIAYCPITRQLHIISSTHVGQQQQQSENCGELKKEVHQNGLQQQLECIEEEGIGDVCSHVVRCVEDDCLSVESPRSTLQRFGTSSFTRTDASSFSSTVSSLSDASPSTNDDPDDHTPKLHGCPESGDCCCVEMNNAKSNRKGISGFFSR